MHLSSILTATSLASAVLAQYHPAAYLDSRDADPYKLSDSDLLLDHYRRMASPPHQGQVKDPEHDHRLKENRDKDVTKHTSNSGASGGGSSHQGEVKGPEHDARLKQNRHRRREAYPPGQEGTVKDPEHDGRLKENRRRRHRRDPEAEEFAKLYHDLYVRDPDAEATAEFRD